MSSVDDAKKGAWTTEVRSSFRKRLFRLFDHRTHPRGLCSPMLVLHVPWFPDAPSSSLVPAACAESRALLLLFLETATAGFHFSLGTGRAFFLPRGVSAASARLCDYLSPSCAVTLGSAQ